MNFSSFGVIGLMLMALSLTKPSASFAQCNASDFELLCNEGDMVNDAVFDCGFSCFLSSDITACFAQCIGESFLR